MTLGISHFLISIKIAYPTLPQPYCSNIIILTFPDKNKFNIIIRVLMLNLKYTKHILSKAAIKITKYQNSYLNRI
jgi:hypothetical protein